MAGSPKLWPNRRVKSEGQLAAFCEECVRKHYFSPYPRWKLETFWGALVGGPTPGSPWREPPQQRLGENYLSHAGIQIRDSMVAKGISLDEIKQAVKRFKNNYGVVHYGPYACEKYATRIDGAEPMNSNSWRITLATRMGRRSMEIKSEDRRAAAQVQALRPLPAADPRLCGDENGDSVLGLRSPTALSR